jgi:hypothetical protein
VNKNMDAPHSRVFRKSRMILWVRNFARLQTGLYSGEESESNVEEDEGDGRR